MRHEPMNLLGVDVAAKEPQIAEIFTYGSCVRRVRSPIFLILCVDVSFTSARCICVTIPGTILPLFVHGQ